MLVIQPVAVLLAAPVFIGVILLTRYVSLGSLLGSAAMFPAMLLVLLVVPETPLPYVIYAAVGAALIWLAHADNIDRLHPRHGAQVRPRAARRQAPEPARVGSCLDHIGTAKGSGASGGAAMTEHEVVIAGAGPTGLMLAAELRLAGIDVLIVERRADQGLDGGRAGGLHARSLEALDQRGVAGRFVTEGRTHPFVGYAGTFLDISDFPTRHNYVLALWQRDIEVILAGWADGLGVAILRGHEVVGFTQDGAGVDVGLSGGTTLRAEYLVGCDGGRSVIRKAAGIDFAGFDASRSYMIAEVEMDAAPPIGMRPEGGGIGPVDREKGGSPYGVVLLEAEVEHADDPTLQDLRAALVAAYGTDFGVHDPTRLSRFTDMTRQAASYRAGRVLLAGDAAHVHSPVGGQGLNVGVQDAANLGWKLAQVIKGTSPESLLDTYHAERHPVGARVLA